MVTGIQPFFRVRRANKEETTGHFFQQEGEIFRAHGNVIARFLSLHPGRAGGRRPERGWQFPAWLTVAGRDALHIDICLATHCTCNAVHGLFEALQYPGTHLRLEGADRAGHFNCRWDDIEGLAAMDGAYTDNGGLQGRHITGNNPLQGADDLCGRPVPGQC